MLLGLCFGRWWETTQPRLQNTVCLAMAGESRRWVRALLAVFILNPANDDHISDIGSAAIQNWINGPD